LIQQLQGLRNQDLLSPQREEFEQQERIFDVIYNEYKKSKETKRISKMKNQDLIDRIIDDSKRICGPSYF
jgi:hypothetical protein